MHPYAFILSGLLGFACFMGFLMAEAHFSNYNDYSKCMSSIDHPLVANGTKEITSRTPDARTVIEHCQAAADHQVTGNIWLNGVEVWQGDKPFTRNNIHVAKKEFEKCMKSFRQNFRADGPLGKIKMCEEATHYDAKGKYYGQDYIWVNGEKKSLSDS